MYVSQMVRRTELYFHRLWESSSLSRCVIDAGQDLKMLPFWIIAEILYGRLTQVMENELQDMVPLREGLFRYFLRGGLTRYAWSRYLPTTANRELAEFKTRWRAFNGLARDQAHTTAPVTACYYAVDEESIEEESILETLDETLFANLDVTLGGISWNLVFLAAHPDVQSRLRQDISIETEKTDGLNTYLLRSDTLVSACISESSRHRTNFIVDSYALNQRNNYWGKDAVQYRPDRFLEQSAVKDRYNFWRFGFGPRQCMEKYVADLMIRVLLVHLVINYELGMLDENKDWGKDPAN
ncbi:Cytochrome P450 94C1 [Elsinoe australis]|uniref:Cytochrome P450 94C1 n=1 Tax=Elsinoe australis TaxID=40998 RepID=A0A2P7Z1B7_9PEZI|nr:Cytochrome P450 94C1 [Elsinoe australis]